MDDLLFVVVVVAFFAVAALFVRWCDRLIGPDDLGAPGDAGRGAAAPPSSPDAEAVAGR